MDGKITIRSTTADDVPVILQFIRELALYERLEHEVVATEEVLRRELFGRRAHAEVIFACLANVPVGFALFFHNFSTFLGLPGIYLEDLFVQAHVRGRGIGRSLLSWLAAAAVERGCGRLEWAVLDWNEPSIRFYRNLGAVRMEDWRTFRLTGAALTGLARKSG